MSIKQVIAELDAEITRLQQAKALLTGETVKRKPGRPSGTTVPTTKKKRNLSPEGRARIAAAVKARWAKQKKGR